jgi:hypothetical protein
MGAQAQPDGTQSANRSSGSLVGRAVVAGIIGGILIDLFLVVSGAAPFPGVYQFIASSVVGQVAFTASSYIWLGVAMHFGVSIVWALLYAFAANAAHSLRKWVVGGLILGVIALIGMQIISTITHIAQPLTVTSIVGSLISHVVFFGLPIAWYVSLPYRRA